MRRGLLFAALAVAALALAPGSAGAATITPTPGFTTDNFVDNTKCSLREAIQIANTNDPTVENACAISGNLGADTIALGKGNYGLTRAEDGTPDDNAQGDLDVPLTASPLVLDGKGAGLTKINAGGLPAGGRAVQAFNKQVTVQELTVVGGHAAGPMSNGGGIAMILASGSLRLVRTEITGNSADGGGGGIFSNGKLTVEDSDVTGNAAALSGGGIAAAGATTAVSKGSLVQGNTAGGLSGGGGIEATTGTLAVMDSTIDDNHTTAGNGGGISIENSVPSALVRDSQITGNTAPDTNFAGGIKNLSSLTVKGQTEIAHNDAGAGGGISSPGALLQITGPVSLHDNSATSDTFSGGGAIQSGGTTTIDGATLEDNHAAQSGGAVNFFANGSGQLSISDSTIHGNSAVSNGGGIQSNGPTSIADSEISTNLINAPDDAGGGAHLGGGLYVAGGDDVTISDSTISTNGNASFDPDDGVWGGGIAVGGDVTLVRTTVSGNLLLGGNTGSRFGAGIMVLNPNGKAHLENTTVSGNSAPAGSGAGGALYVGLDTTTVVLQSTIAGNGALTAPGIKSDGATTLVRSIIDEGGGACVGPGTFTANARNLDAGMSCVGAVNDTDLGFTAAMLGGLANNGGPTRTRALLQGSPAINAIPNANACTGLDKQPLTTDQRGFPRPVPAGGACDSGAFEVQ